MLGGLVLYQEANFVGTFNLVMMGESLVRSTSAPEMKMPSSMGLRTHSTRTFIRLAAIIKILNW